MTTTTFLRCKTHSQNIRFAVVAGGGDCGFVRAHYHVNGICQKWNGLTGETHRLDNGLRCDKCNRTMDQFTVTGRETETECGDKCQSATGPACECKCKGENHGVAA